MNILLSGIPEKKRVSVKKTIEKMILDIFKNDIHDITEISIPDDFISAVNSAHKEKFPNQLYLEEGALNTLRGKNFNYENDFRVILNKNYSDEDLFSTLYHELVHGKYYHSIKAYDYLKYDQDNLVEAFSFSFIDEYNAYKETFFKYPKQLDEYNGYIDEAVWILKNLAEPNYRIDQLNVFEQANIYSYNQYMYRIKAILSISMAVIDVYEELDNKNLFENYLKYYDGKPMSFTIQCLHSLINSINNNIPTESEFSDVKKCFYDISCFYDIYCDDED